jgi:hypothetical protein
MGKKGLKCSVQRRPIRYSASILFAIRICGIVGAPCLTAALLAIVSVLVQHEPLQQRTRISEENKAFCCRCKLTPAPTLKRYYAEIRNKYFQK